VATQGGPVQRAPPSSISSSSTAPRATFSKGPTKAPHAPHVHQSVRSATRSHRDQSHRRRNNLDGTQMHMACPDSTQIDHSTQPENCKRRRLSPPRPLSLSLKLSCGARRSLLDGEAQGRPHAPPPRQPRSTTGNGQTGHQRHPRSKMATRESPCRDVPPTQKNTANAHLAARATRALATRSRASS